jgi:two-component system, chemotaxis family, CheB/CheR fusion protein
MNSTLEAQREPDFPIVGIGASAGGIEACSRLLRSLPPDVALAAVVVQHLAPTYESKLAELLARETSLRLATASDGARVRPGCVYVIPPNIDLLIEHGSLRLTPRAEGAGRHMPIDLFFRSLAVDRTHRAVGVLLSGAGSDGTLGMTAIRAEGGLTFAQDATAAHDAMPRSAIAAGSVDFVLPPEEIARELVRLAQRVPTHALAQREPEDEQSFFRVLAALRSATGVDFAQYKQATIRRRVLRRMLLNGLGSVSEYADLLDQQPSEVEALCEDVLVQVTSFFRDPQVLDALSVHVFPHLVAERPSGAPIRVWIPGCSSGEEVYSLAILLLEYLGDAGADIPVKLFGTDIGVTALEKARSGKYLENIALDVSPARLRQYFVATDGGYQVRQHVRDLCLFARQDVTRDPPFSHVDLVSCRNLMIYLGPALQGRVLPIFHYALNERGFLLLGGSESVSSHPGFTEVDSKHKIFVRSPMARRAPLDFGEPRHSDTPVPVRAPQAVAQLEIQKEVDRVVLDEFAPPGVVVTDDLVILQFRGQTGAYLKPAAGVATFDLLRMVRDDLRLELRQTIDEARKTGARAHRRVELARGPIDLTVLPFTTTTLRRHLFAILFAELAPPPEPDSDARAAVHDSESERQLRVKLADTRGYIQSVIEQAEASNEELRAANDELQRINEELQTAKEEQQAVNEELSTVNQEMMERNREATRLSDDLTNILTSVNIPIVIVGRDGRIRRFTPSAGKVLNLIAADVARPLSDIKPNIDAPDLMAIIDDVIEHLAPIERTVKDAAGRWYGLSVRPYMTLDKRVDGAVIVLVDVDALKRGEQLLSSARDFAESIVDTVREGLLVLDENLRVRSANRPFCQAFDLSRKDVIGRPIAEIGRGEWNDPALARAFEAVQKGGSLEGFRFERELPKIGCRVMLLNARRFERDGAPAAWLLVAIEDVTEATRSEEALREMLGAAANPILMTDKEGRIVFANAAAHRTFLHEPGELLGTPLDGLVPERLRPQHSLHRAAFFSAAVARTMGRPGMDLVARRKDGTEFPLEVTLSPLRVGASGPLVVAFLSDIGERKETERKILDYQEKLHRMAFDAVLGEERERRRIAADLHDGVGQTLALAQIKLDSTRSLVAGQAGSTIEECVRLVEQSIAETRSLTFDLSPPILYDLGLLPAIRWLAEQIEKRYGVHVEVEGDDRLEMDPEVAALVFRSVRELLTNVCKHASTPAAKVTLQPGVDRVGIVVEDTGLGFDPAETPSGFGLFSARSRIHRLGGTVEIQAAPGQGTRVSLSVPLSWHVSETQEKKGHS